MDIMQVLPPEVIEKILQENCISIEDAKSFCDACSQSRGHADLIGSNRLWKTKFLQRWPDIKPHHVENVRNWYEEVHYMYVLIDNVNLLLKDMPPKYCCYMDISEREFGEWNLLAQETPRTYKYMLEYLKEIVATNTCIQSITTVPLLMNGNQTLKYYALKALRFLRKNKLRMAWSQIIKGETKNKLLEKGAVIIAQWCQPHLEVEWESDVALKLDDLAQQVKDHLKLRNHKHSIFSKTTEELTSWKYEILDDNQYEAAECMQMIDSIKYILADTFHFRGNLIDYYDPMNSMINKVLKLHIGLPILLSIIYESVGRRVGIHFEPANIPKHFLLRYKEGRGAHRNIFYLDGYNNGNMLQLLDCPYIANTYSRPDYPAASMELVMERICGNLENSMRRCSGESPINHLSVLELAVTINPQDLNSVVQLARQYMLYNMDTKPLEEYVMQHNPPNSEQTVQVQRIVKMMRDYEANVKIHNRDENGTFFNQTRGGVTPRVPEVKFAVGMVMKHLTLDYICVICDWHLRCLASCEWQQRMNVSRLRYKGDQPFYSVIADDGSHRYVAQENLEPSYANQELMQVEDVGRHFSHYFYVHFVPNEEKERNYAEDAHIRNLFYQRRVLENPNRYPDVI